MKLWEDLMSFTAITIFQSYVMSYLEYGSIFLDCISVSLRNKFQRLQNKCLWVCHLVDSHTSNYRLHKRSNVLLLRLRRKMSICSLMYRKIQKNPTLLHVSGWVGNRSYGSYMVTTPLPRKESFKRSISYVAPNTWNNLPSCIRNSNNTVCFKRRFKRYLSDGFCQDEFVYIIPR